MAHQGMLGLLVLAFREMEILVDTADVATARHSMPCGAPLRHLMTGSRGCETFPATASRRSTCAF
jgi:hypothetical protein